MIFFIGRAFTEWKENVMDKWFNSIREYTLFSLGYP